MKVAISFTFRYLADGPGSSPGSPRDNDFIVEGGWRFAYGRRAHTSGDLVSAIHRVLVGKAELLNDPVPCT